LEGKQSHERFVKNFLERQFPAGDVPVWVVEALTEGAGLVGIQSTLIVSHSVDNSNGTAEKVD